MLNKKVLIADDDTNLVRTMGFILEREGYDFCIAMNGEEAMAKIREEMPAVVILDVMMPLKDGYAVCEDVKSDPDMSDVYIIFLSAKGQNRDKQRGFAVGADEYIPKPFIPSEVVNRITKLLGNPQKSFIRSR